MQNMVDFISTSLEFLFDKEVISFSVFVQGMANYCIGQMPIQ